MKKAIFDILNEEDSVFVHGYMSNAGYEDVRKALADSINKRFGTNYGAKNFIMTVGAATALNIVLKTILNPEDEVIAFAPYFVEYGNYVRNYDGKLVVIPPDVETFMPDLAVLEEKINERTKAIIINTPNNPSGVIYSEETLQRLKRVIEKKEKELGIIIVTISDEPYRELAYDGAVVPWVPEIIPHAVVVYSYSKSLSLPGERIGWLLIPDRIPDFDEFVNAATIANRCMGSVNAPSLMQRVIGRCLDAKVDVDFYDRNRKLLYDGLSALGFFCVKPEGAFYMFVRVPQGDDKLFCEVCKRHHILVVPGTSFACPGFVRIAYCVSQQMIERSMEAFKKVAKECGL